MFLGSNEHTNPSDMTIRLLSLELKSDIAALTSSFKTVLQPFLPTNRKALVRLEFVGDGTNSLDSSQLYIKESKNGQEYLFYRTRLVPRSIDNSVDSDSRSGVDI